MVDTNFLGCVAEFMNFFDNIPFFSLSVQLEFNQIWGAEEKVIFFFKIQ